MAASKKADMETFRKIWAKIVARAWADDQFKQKLLSRPNEVLKEYGLAVPAGTTFKVVEQTAKTEYLFLPKKAAGEISTEELRSVAAGAAVTSSALGLESAER